MVETLTENINAPVTGSLLTTHDNQTSVQNTSPLTQINSLKDLYSGKTQIAPDAFQISSSGQDLYKIKEFTVTAEVELTGNPFIRPRQFVFVEGVGIKFSGAWIVGRVIHKINKDKNFVTLVTLVRNVIGLPKVCNPEKVAKTEKSTIEKKETPPPKKTSSKPAEKPNFIVPDSFKKTLEKERNYDIKLFG